MNPLVPGIRQPRLLSEGGGFAAANHHRYALLISGAEKHGGVEGARRRVQQNRLGFAVHLGVPRGYGHRQRFVTTIDVARPIESLLLQLGKRFPYRRPLGSGRRKDVVNARARKNLYQCLTTVHNRSSERSASRVSCLGFRLTRDPRLKTQNVYYNPTFFLASGKKPVSSRVLTKLPLMIWLTSNWATLGVTRETYFCTFR